MRVWIHFFRFPIQETLTFFELGSKYVFDSALQVKRLDGVEEDGKCSKIKSLMFHTHGYISELAEEAAALHLLCNHVL